MATASTATNPVQEAPPQVELDFGAAIERIDSWLDGGIRLLPNILVALVIFILFYGLGLLARSLILRQSHRRKRDNLGEVLGSFIKWAIILLGFLLAATIVLPSLKPADLITGLGVSSVAIGFAFKDILQNWLAGLLILLRQPFNIHDQIEVNGHEGTVQRIETRATIIKTYDGQRIVIPNSQIYTNAVRVITAHRYRRSEYDIGIGYDDDLDLACQLLTSAVANVTQVEAAPEVEVLPWELAPSWVTLRVRWWTHSHKADVNRVHAKVIRTIKMTLDEAGIEMPSDSLTCVVRQQEEASEAPLPEKEQAH